MSRHDVNKKYSLKCKKFLWAVSFGRPADRQVFPIIKREDEKRVTEQAWDNPKFVEDSVGDLANTLKNEPSIVWFRCSSENFESIHHHNAHAEIEFDKALG